MNLSKTISVLILMLSLMHFSSRAQSKISNMFTENKQFIGLQFNPYLLAIEDISYMRYKSKVFAVRYGMNVIGNLSIGPEISGFYEKAKDLRYNVSKTNLGIFARYTFFEQSGLRPIVESSVYYQHGRYHDALQFPENWRINKFGWYGAAGMGVNVYKKKVTIDLMIKYSPDVQFKFLKSDPSDPFRHKNYYQKFVPTYKINYHIH